MLRVAAGVVMADAELGPALDVHVLPGRGWVEGAVLLARRRPEKRQGGLWELPGGKIEAGESAAQCLMRELDEELGLRVEVRDYVATSVHDYGTGPIALEAWVCWLRGGVPEAVDHDALAWVLPADLETFALAAADVPLARALARGRAGA